MKSMKRIFALAMVLVMVMAVFAPAALASGNGTITISTTGSLSLQGQEFKAYKVFDLPYYEGDSYAYEITEKFANYPDAATLEDDINTAGADLNAIANSLYNYVKDMGADKTGTGVGQTAVIDGLTDGYYLVIGTATTKDGEIITTACGLVTVTLEHPGVITLKADAPTIDKKVDDHGTLDNHADVNIGDTVTFTLTSKVPTMTGYSSYTFIVHDTMSPGLTYVDNSISVTGGGDYTPVVSKDGNNTLITITFNDMINQTPGTDIIITYSATLNADAEIANDANPNSVYLEYSNNPYDTSSTEDTPEKPVYVYTFDLNIFKFTGEDVALKDAEFKLYRDSELPEGGEVTFAILADGTYQVAKNGTVDTLISNGDGKIKIEGLDEGTYYLKETKAPAGFNLLLEAREVVIAATYNEDGTIASYTINGDVGGEVAVENNSGTLFPETGGIGTKIFTVVGLVLMVGAAVVLIAKKKAISSN